MSMIVSKTSDGQLAIGTQAYAEWLFFKSQVAQLWTMPRLLAALMNTRDPTLSLTEDSGDPELISKHTPTHLPLNGAHPS